MNNFSRLVISFAGIVAFPGAAAACMLYPVEPDDVDVEVEGRYFQDSEDRSLGYVYVDRRNDGVWDRRYEVHWDLYALDDPSLSACVIQVPTHGSYGNFGLSRLEEGGFWVLFVGLVQDPNEIDEDAE
jgi:hypothetical protein